MINILSIFDIQPPEDDNKWDKIKNTDINVLVNGITKKKLKDFIKNFDNIEDNELEIKQTIYWYQESTTDDICNLISKIMEENDLVITY